MSQRPAHPQAGILWMLAAVLMFASVNTTAKTLAETLPVMQVVWARYFFQMLLLVIYVGPRLPKVLVTNKLGQQLGRSMLLLMTTILFFFGLSQVPLADATAIMFIAPIVVTALSMPLLGEKVGPRRWVGIAIGFIGALIIIRPGLGVVQMVALLPVGAACLHALYQLSTRFLSHSEKTMTTLAYTASTGAVLSSIAAPFFWVTPTPGDWLLMVGIGLFAALGHFSMIKSYECAPAAIVAPFSYANLVWATLFGYIFFADLPDIWTISGALIIAASGLYIYHREQAQNRAETVKEPTP
ncbi:MAG: DMT family transporter [Alphaproteobacteria bacterium]